MTAFYPGSDNGQVWRPCDIYDNRRRPWTIQIMEKPIDYKFYIDLSPSMLGNSNDRPGGYKIAYLLRQILQLFSGEQGLVQVLKANVTLIDLQNPNRNLTLTKMDEQISTDKIKSFLAQNRKLG